MTGNDLQSYAPLLLHLILAMALSGVLLLLSSLVGWRRPSKVKSQAYECGITPTGDAREPFSVKFYLVAMIFILFDVEAIFLYPWAFIFGSCGGSASWKCSSTSGSCWWVISISGRKGRWTGTAQPHAGTATS